MNPIAADLNERLADSVAARLFSDLGRRLYFPKGIAAQSAEAKERAKVLNATIGMACEGKQPIMLPSMAAYINGLSSAEVVGYAPTGGVAALRRIWKEEILRKNPALRPEHTSLPIVTAGLTNAIAMCADLFIERGDSIVTADMLWGNYRLIGEMRHEGTITTYPQFDTDGHFNHHAFRTTLEAQAAHGKVIVLLNFPNNPAGYLPYPDEVDAIATSLREVAESGVALLALIDDAYFGLRYDEQCYQWSLFNVLATLHPNILAVKIDGATKEEFAWGLRVGFATFGGASLTADHYDALQCRFTGALRSSISNCSTIGQQLVLRQLRSPTHAQEKKQQFEQLRLHYQRTQDILSDHATEDTLTPLPFNAGYFLCLRCNGISAEILRQKLLDDGIGTIAIGTTLLRVAYASIDIEQLERLFAAIYTSARRLRAGG